MLEVNIFLEAFIYKSVRAERLIEHMVTTGIKTSNLVKTKGVTKFYQENISQSDLKTSETLHRYFFYFQLLILN